MKNGLLTAAVLLLTSTSAFAVNRADCELTPAAKAAGIKLRAQMIASAASGFLAEHHGLTLIISSAKAGVDGYNTPVVHTRASDGELLDVVAYALVHGRRTVNKQGEIVACAVVAYPTSVTSIEHGPSTTGLMPIQNMNLPEATFFNF